MNNLIEEHTWSSGRTWIFLVKKIKFAFWIVRVSRFSIICACDDIVSCFLCEHIKANIAKVSWESWVQDQISHCSIPAHICNWLKVEPKSISLFLVGCGRAQNIWCDKEAKQKQLSTRKKLAWDMGRTKKYLCQPVMACIASTLTEIRNQVPVFQPPTV